MSPKTPPTHKQYTDSIINLIQTVNPYTTDQGRKGYVYAAGFLASYLASLSQEDPYIYLRFRRHIEEQQSDRKN